MSNIVLTGVDGSETAMAAARTAGRLATALDAELHVVCAYEKLSMEHAAADGNEYTFTSAESAQALADETFAALRGHQPGLRGVATAQQGKPADVLIAMASDLGASLVVVGNKRVQGRARILGSIATHVLHQSPCDVYVAHTHPLP
jgi:nucleotide-binding universal stress UspA family protein